ncbi:uncharacterized protein A1O5_10401 [Cladophialophora psammophila CBS 110553]|uniref:Glucose-methanol-choline oxidoreductase N-terminal domain-containing protein n=1 Tax=Cladophialophora psammophila CBS 110553 TaxID=1182543 RepID=W9X729_9EURO|nr:uncharacterized protein A1O5_10401 [Cladophialophora psammophila CBS 110553]EXJ66249.1 hypothetical protein A1O5_10401 [Cladophialophora psammophila CBS 110553]
MASADGVFDYIIVGGGIAGCTLASLLSKSKPSPSVLLIEAGPDVSNRPLTQAPVACFAADGSDIDWNYKTVPQSHLDNRPLYEAGGKALVGGSATNYATWTRGSRFDYDRRAVSESSSNRKYPLRDQVLKAWLGLGLDKIANANNGDPLGVGEMVESWKDGRRQLTSMAFDLTDVTVMTEILSQTVLLEEQSGKLATKGVQFHDGRHFLASKEVILSGEAFRTPQLLMLSGIGPAAELKKENIPPQHIFHLGTRPSSDYPNYNAPSVATTLLRYGIRRLLKAVHNSMSDVVESENPPPPFEALAISSSDEAIDARVNSEAHTFFHAAGTASMGSVLDTKLRVKGVSGLRVVDASVILLPIGARLQVAAYAIAAHAADLIGQE